MEIINKIKKESLKCYIAYVKYCVALFFVFTVGFFLLRFPEKTSDGIREGLEISAQVLIPTLFPFLVFSSLIVNSDLCTSLSSHFEKITKLLFSQSEQCFAVFLMSLVGGYPVGAGMIKSLYEKGEITRDEGQRMLLFCFNTAPAFAISTVGFGMLKSQRMGVVINISVILSALIIGILTRFIKTDEGYYKKQTEIFPKYSFSQNLVNSVSQSINSIFMICAWVMLFTCIISLSDIVTDNETVKNFICSVCEVTSGCKFLYDKVPIPVLAGIISFGGLCTHLQIMSAIVVLKLKYVHFLVSRIIGAALSMVICQVIINVFPQSTQVISIGQKPVYTEHVTSFAITAALLALCGLILIGDNYTFKLKHNNH